jgi:hypothetical protein
MLSLYMISALRPGATRKHVSCYDILVVSRSQDEKGHTMAGKKVWMTWLPADDLSHRLQPLVHLLGQYGLEVGGAKWVDDLNRMGWLELGTVLLDTANADSWVIAGDHADFARPSNRYALSLLTATIHQHRGEGFPIICLGLDAIPNAAMMPTLMRALQFMGVTDQGWPAKAVAAAFNPKKLAPPEFRFGVYANPMFGQWFEVGPRHETWGGAMFGVSAEGTISQHAVGPMDQVPERTVLEYEIQGMQAQVGETTFTAFAVQNTLGLEDSYYVKVEGFPARIICGGHPGTDQAEVFVIDLK